MVSVLSVGIIGCGGIATAHAEAWSRFPEAKVAAVSDVVEERARALASKCQSLKGFQPDVYVDYVKLLECRDIDVISVCLPHYLHAPVTVEAAKAGKHVLCEKPMAVSLRQADDMISTCRRNGVKLGIVFQSRFSPDTKKVKRAMDAQELGRPVLADAWVKWFRSDKDYFHRDAVAESWRGKWDTEGGAVLINQAIHTIDLLQWFMGPVKRLTGFYATLTHRIEAEDVAAAVLMFRSGALGVIEGSLCTQPNEAQVTQMQIHGERGTIALKGDNIAFWKTVNESAAIQAPTVEQVTPPPPVPPPMGHQAVVRDFLDAVLQGGDPSIPGEEGRKSLEIVLAVYKAFRTNSVVTFPLEE